MVVDPERFRRWEFAPPLAVTELKVGGALGAPDQARRWIFRDAAATWVQCRVAALDFTAPQRSRYQYRFEGFDADWIDSDPGRRVASYNSLSPEPMCCASAAVAAPAP